MTTPPIRRRTRARELALQFLYAFELRGEDAMSELESFVDHHTKTGNMTQGNAAPGNRLEVANYAKDICLGVHDHLVDINNWIEHIARNWRLERMAYIDRNILRIAMYELLFQAEVPFKVVINEAIDMAKRYSTAQSGSFVNGILDRARVLIQEARDQGTISIPTAPEKSVILASSERKANSISGSGNSSSLADLGSSPESSTSSGLTIPDADPSLEPFPVPKPRQRRLKPRPTPPNDSDQES